GDETAVDLQFVDREAPQVTHARVAGAEVIDRHQHTHATDRFEDDDRFLGIAHHRALGQLDLEVLRIELRRLERLADLLYQGRKAELRWRKIHRHAHRPQPFLLPRLRLPARLEQYPLADGIEQAAFLGDRNEILRWHQATLRMAPADQCLGAVD